MKNWAIKWAAEAAEMEMLTDYTCHLQHTSDWNKLVARKDEFISREEGEDKPARVNIEDFGEVEVEHLRNNKQSNMVLQQAFDLKMRMVAYWKIVLKRLVDSMALQLQLSIHKLVNKELEKQIVSELMKGGHGGVGIERLMEEWPWVAGKRARLNASVKKLKECRRFWLELWIRLAQPELTAM